MTYFAARNVDGSCGGVKATKYGYIASPNFPHSEYPPVSDCEWKIIVSKNQVIRVGNTLLSLSTSLFPATCENSQFILFVIHSPSHPHPPPNTRANRYKLRQIFSSMTPLLLALEYEEQKWIKQKMNNYKAKKNKHLLALQNNSKLT